MTRALVALVTLVLAGCASQPSKPPAPASAGARAQPDAPPPAAPATQAAPALAPAPPFRATAPPAPAPSASRPSPAQATPAPAPVPAPEILYVKTHLANFRQGAGTSMKILRVLRQGARLQVLESRNTWLRVRLDDGQEGWVAESVTSATAPVTPARAPTRDPGAPEIAGA